jgi:hypothetical protein
MASKRRYAANNNPQLPVRITKENKDKAGITSDACQPTATCKRKEEKRETKTESRCV